MAPKVIEKITVTKHTEVYDVCRAESHIFCYVNLLSISVDFSLFPTLPLLRFLFSSHLNP